MSSFSIIVPVYNGATHLEDCIKSVVSQIDGAFNYEILLIDDCSTDSSPDICKQLKIAHPEHIKNFKTDKNSGPGFARNVGLSNASHDWILFLDSDDQLQTGALKKLNEFITSDQTPSPDIIGFNWCYSSNSTVNNGRKGGRYDFKSLSKPKPLLLADSIALGMDGSVIYTAIKRDLIEKSNLRFHGGVHEDVDFIFKVYWYAAHIGRLEDILYQKNNREGSIVNSISSRHIQGYFRAYREILSVLNQANQLEKYEADFYTGLIGIIATRLRDISILNLSEPEATKLYNELYKNWLELTAQLNSASLPELQTKYGIITAEFLKIMESDESPFDAVAALIEDVKNKSWSCYDLHNSLFLAPDEVRTCCKRFFVDGEMKGDVTIAKANKEDPSSITLQTLLDGKKDLYNDINRGACEECAGCPFLEFKDWGYIEDLTTEHLSLEYHSVCNMKCSYCSEEYYGGEQAHYDVEKLVTSLFDQGLFDKGRTVVWGGGEPALGESFIPLTQLIANKLPNLKQRILTNCVKYSEEIYTLLKNDKATLLTSIDAGTKSTFELIRGSTQFKKVFKNLEKYATTNTKNITIKYIFTEGNSSQEEVDAFVNLISQHNLQDCSFQISSDFKHETINADSATSMIMCYGLLLKAGCRLVYFDELLRQRFFIDSNEMDEKIRAELSQLGLSDTLANKNQFEKIIIWGAGHQTQLLLENSNFFRNVNVDYIVDSTPSKINTTFMGYKVKDPETLSESNAPVLISAVQNSPIIYKKYIELGLEESRLIKGLII